MTYDDLLAIVAGSSRDEWVSNGKHWTYKPDLMIRLEDTTNDEYEDRRDRDFNEEWAMAFPDKNARRVSYTLYYGPSVVKKVDMVSVDGGRTLIPMTKSPTEHTITEWQYRFAKIVELHPGPDSAYNLDTRLKQAGITVKG